MDGLCGMPEPYEELWSSFDAECVLFRNLELAPPIEEEGENSSSPRGDVPSSYIGMDCISPVCMEFSRVFRRSASSLM